MNDMKLQWETPRIEIEAFEANEYVAACWGVGCKVDDANQIEKNLGKYQQGVLDHGADHCGNAGNQVIYDDNNDGTADRMVEVGTDGLGTLTCTLYTNGNYTKTMPVSTITSEWIGQTIYWTTASGNKTWHHVGEVFQTVPNHPNRS